VHDLVRDALFLGEHDARAGIEASARALATLVADVVEPIQKDGRRDPRLTERSLDAIDVLVERSEGAFADRGIERRADAQTIRLDRELRQRMTTSSEKNDRNRVKAPDPSLRCPAVMVAGCTIGGCMLAIAMAEPAAKSTRPVPPPAKNAISFTAGMNIPRFAVGIGYDRAVHRRVSVGARFESAIPKTGYAHLVGWVEGVALAVWAPRAYQGFFAEANLSVGHTVLGVQPRLHSVSVAPGATVGVRWRFGKHLFIGASGGLRWGILAHRNPAICTFSAACPAIRKGPTARATIEIGVAF
jgi:hypothetical protein